MNLSKKYIFFSQQLKKRGFTLVETLIAILILLTVTVATMTLAAQGISNTTSSRDQVIATYLAQDAIEAIITKKRENLLQTPPNPWLLGITDSGMCTNTVNCRIDSLRIGASGFAVSCPASGCPKIKYESVSGRYGYVTGTDTKFTRTIRITNYSNNADEKLVTVTVSWRSGNVTRNVTVKTNILNTRP